ncbi:MAG TPA: GNAT family N-acetyltransferase [Gaiellaceae bacterium]|nr:GNAT family N-acetyltransferase [Gaiellaceae bacterium]
MNVRAATEHDLAAIQALWRDFEQEVPPPEHVDVDHERELREIEQIVREELAFVALDESGEPAGFALARRKQPRLGFLSDLYVRPDARRHGAARALVREVAAAFAEQGVEFVSLEVGASNEPARAVYTRWGFREHLLELVVPLETLADRLRADYSGRTFGSVHIQTDDQAAIERAVRQFVPRLPGGSRGSVVSAPRHGWIAVYDDVCERDPQQLRRLAKELGDRTGGIVLAIGIERGAVVRFVLFERGSVVDEYLSVQEFYGPLPPGDVIALAANPRVVSRLTGADPRTLRAAAVHAATPQELPPPEEVLAGIAAAMGIEGTEHGWSDLPDLPGSIRIER